MLNIFSKLVEINPIIWAILAVIIVISLLALIFLPKDAQSTSTSTTKKVVYGGLCISIAFVLSYIRLFKMPQGGSITLASMFPLVLYSMVFGPISGIVAGVAYGFLQFIQDGSSSVHFLQLLLDYPLAFGCLGLAGIAPNMIKSVKLRTSLAVVIAVLGRCVMHVISGAIFFAEYAPEGMNPWIYSIGYNGSFLLVELVITLVLSLAIMQTSVYSAIKKSAAA